MILQRFALLKLSPFSKRCSVVGSMPISFAPARTVFFSDSRQSLISFLRSIEK